MMRTYLKTFFFICLCITIGRAQGQSAKVAPQTFVIRGTVKNFKDSVWRFFYPGFLKNQVIEMHVAANGSFSKTIPISNPNDVGLYLNDIGVKVFAAPGDILTMTWDDQDFKNTFKVKANTETRQKEIDLMLELAQYRKPMMEMAKNKASTSDSVKLKKANNFFAEQVRVALKYPQTENWEKVVYDQYFDDLLFLKALRIKEKDSQLVLDKPLADSLEKRGIRSFNSLESTLNEALFLKSYLYRDEIIARVHRGSLFNSYYPAGNSGTDAPLNFTMNDCYAGMACLYWSPQIKDWYLTKSIINGFGHYKFELAEQAYVKFLPEINTLIFKDELITYHNTLMRSLKPGVPAPAFKLKDANGKPVSLSDFKGKTVYIDFWGVNCGPCLYDIKNYAAALHEKYKDKNVIFLNICVDANNAEWKKTLGSLNMQGTNLIAEGWTNNPVCKAYNIDAIPHYVLVDPKGNIVNNNAPTMGEIQNGKSEIDKLLGVK